MRSALLFAVLATVRCDDTGDVYDRKLGAIVGALVADAAVMPLHWMYNTSVIASLVGDSAPEFHDPPSCPFYHYPLGDNTPYGQQTLVYLKEIAESGTFTPEGLVKAYYAFYGAKGAPCEVHTSEGVPCPVHTNKTCCYWDGSTTGFVNNMRSNKTVWPSCGVDDNQANALVHMLLATVWSDKLEDVLANSNTIIRVTQNSNDAVAFGSAGARVLHNAITGASGRESVRSTAAALLDLNRVSPNKEDFVLAAGMHLVMEEEQMSNFDVTQQVGQSCGFPNNLFSGSHLLYQLPDTNTTEAFINATRQVIMAGGDSGSRGFFVGSVLGALAGESGLPEAWKQKYLHYAEVLDLAKMLLKHAHY